MVGVIRIENLGKRFRLFHERPRSLKEVVALRRRRRFDEFWALRDVSFTVARGETIGIIGANGSGKSTLLKCLARILVPDEGSIAIDGRVGALLELGTGFHPELTGRENVFLNGSILGVARRELKARFDEIVSLAGLERFIDTPVKNYSSGMYIRLGFAVAVSVRPDILLVDEVLAVGDEEFQRKCLAKFQEIRAEGGTVVLVTHALDAVREICGRAVLLREGRIADLGAAPGVVETYLRAVGAAAPSSTPGPAPRDAADPLEITLVEFLGVEDRRSSPVVAGGPMQARIHWRTHAPVTDPVFRVDFFAKGAMSGAAQATSKSDGHLGPLEGSGVAELRVDDLLLAPGDYEASVVVHDLNDTIEYGRNKRAQLVVVHPGSGLRQSGFVRLPGHWDVRVAARQ